MVKTVPIEAANELLWNVLEISLQLEHIHSNWAARIKVTQAQWLILMAIRDLDTGPGVPGVDVAEKLHLHSGYISKQTKGLEKRGLVSRQPSGVDGRIVLLSLTSKAMAEVERLSEHRVAVNSTLFNRFDAKAVAKLNEALAIIGTNARLVARLLSIDLN